MTQTTLDAFDTMWGPFPEPVFLVQKDRTILAVNELARTLGVPPGIKCFSLNADEGKTFCKRCQANLALSEHRPVRSDEMQDGKPIIGYWMPLKAEKDVFVHFGIGCADAIAAQTAAAQASAELVQL